MILLFAAGWNADIVVDSGSLILFPLRFFTELRGVFRLEILIELRGVFRLEND